MTIAANHPLKGARPPAWGRRAIRWWLGELRACRDDLHRALLTRAGRGVTIEAGERYWLLRQGERPIGQVDARGGEAAQLLHLLPSQRSALTVEIPPERALVKNIVLPVGAGRQLDRILDFEIARHFPFPAERVYFCHRIAGETAGGVTVEIVAVPREVVDGVCAALGEAGLRVAAVTVGDPAGTPLLLPAATLGVARREAAPATRHLTIAALAAVSAALVSWPFAQQAALRSLDRELAALKPGAEAALRADEAERHASERNAAILALRGARPPLVAALDTLSRDLPDGAWLLSLSIAGREVVLDGLAPSAAAVALALEKSRDVGDIVFRSPITRDASGLEHFQLGATLAGVKP